MNQEKFFGHSFLFIWMNDIYMMGISQNIEYNNDLHDENCDDDDGKNDNEVDNNDDSGIAITIPMLGWDLDTAGSNQRLNKTSPAQHTIMVMMMMRWWPMTKLYQTILNITCSKRAHSDEMMM